MSSTIGGVRIVDMPDLGAVTDTSSVVGEHAGSGRFGVTALRTYVKDVVSVRDYGAVGNGSTDDAAAFQAAVNAAISGGKDLYIPRVAGSYRIGSTVTISGALTVIGGGWDAVGGPSSNIMPGAGITCFMISAQSAVTFRDVAFGIGATSIQTAGTTITVDPGAGAINYFSHFDHCFFHAQYLAIDFVRAVCFTLFHCLFNECNRDVLIRNTTENDQGDSNIIACEFEQDASYGLSAGSYLGWGVQQASSGGLKIVASKFNGHGYGYILSLDCPQSGGTTDLIIENSSFENIPNAAITLQQSTSNSHTFGNINITGNQIAYCNTGVALRTGTGPLAWLKNFIITDNLMEISLPGGVGPVTSPGVGIAIENGSSYGVIAGNLIRSPGGNVTGISLANLTTEIRVDSTNEFYGLLTNIYNPGPSNRVEPDVQSGTVVLTTANAYGPLFFSPPVTVTFPRPFRTVPVITGTAATTGGVALLIDSLAVGTVGLRGIGIANTTAYTFYWTAAG